MTVSNRIYIVLVWASVNGDQWLSERVIEKRKKMRQFMESIEEEVNVII